MTNAHLVRMDRDDDPELYARRLERIAWQRYLRVSMTLAATSLKAPAMRLRARKRVEIAKADFADAWRGLCEVQP